MRNFRASVEAMSSMLWRCYLLFGICQIAQATTVWIDTDVSIGSPIREVDDAFAIVLAFHSPELRIAGLSTTYGNAPLASTTRAARDLAQRFGGSAAITAKNVFAGARSPGDLGRRTAATDALAGVLQKKRVTYIALGPLTNLASFLQCHPTLADRIDRVIFVGGQSSAENIALGSHRSFRIHDANVGKDPVAAERVLRSRIPLLLVPIQTASGLLIDASDMETLRKCGPESEYLWSRSRVWFWFWTCFVRNNGGPIFDALGIIPVTNPKLLSIQKQYARMESGRLIATPRPTNGARPVLRCTGFAPGTKTFVMERICARLRSHFGAGLPSGR